jgi:AcrR family transcriptional regulator
MFRMSNGGGVGVKLGNSGKRVRARGRIPRSVRADAQRNLNALLKAAMAVFATSGVDAPVRQIAAKAGVGLGTVYRHFPQRSDLIAAVFRREIDACADAAPVLAAAYAPGEALARWMRRYVDFVAAKRGLAPALHSGDPAFDSLRPYFEQRLRPALQALLASAAAAREVRTDVDAEDILGAVASLCMHAFNQGPEHARRMVSLFVDGLRYGAKSRAKSTRAAHGKTLSKPNPKLIIVT